MSQGPTDASETAPLAMRGVALISGLMFGAGLLMSGMTRPEKVIGFLDVTGAWDPSLAFVMVGAIAVYSLAAMTARRQIRPCWADSFHWPSTLNVDARLVGGSALFGVGWGLAGYCPGPALVSIGAGSIDAAWFGGSMLLGMLVYRATGSTIDPPLTD